MAEETERATRPPPPRWILATLVGAGAVLIIANYIGFFGFAALVERHPAVLLALNASNKTLVGVTNQLDAPTYYSIGFLRLSIGDPIFYLLGLLYGNAALRSIERKAGDRTTSIQWLQAAFHKARYPMVLIAPNHVICLLAGATRMAVVAFASLNVIGTAGRLYLARRLGVEFQGPIEATTSYLDRYRWPIVAASLALFALQSKLKKRKDGTPGGQLASLSELREEIDLRATAPESASGSGT